MVLNYIYAVVIHLLPVNHFLSIDLKIEFSNEFWMLWSADLSFLFLKNTPGRSEINKKFVYCYEKCKYIFFYMKYMTILFKTI